MMTLLLLTILQCVLLVGTQTFFKMSFDLWGDITWGWPFIKTMLSTWQLAAAGVCGVGATFLWVYLMKRYPFNQAYTLQCISYVIGMFSARFILGETIPLTRWIGALIIMIGVFFIIK